MLEKIYLEMLDKNSKLRNKLERHINDFIDKLETEEGVLARDATQVSKFQTHMAEFFEKHSIPYLVWLVSAIDKLLKEAVKNFEDDGAKYEDIAFFKELYGIKGGKVMRERNGQQTALYSLATMSVITLEIVNRMQGAMVGDSSMSDFRGAVDKTISRKFNDFFAVNTTAVLFNTYNAANRFFAKEYNYTKFRYEGGLIADSRDFCVERDGHEFFIEEGERWNEYEWKGKIPGVDFFVQVGGYSCRHWLVYLK